MTKLQIKKLANSIIKSDKWNIRLTTLANLSVVNPKKKNFYSNAFRVYLGDKYIARTYWLNGNLKDKESVKKQLLISLQYMGILVVKCKLNKKDK